MMLSPHPISQILFLPTMSATRPAAGLSDADIRYGSNVTQATALSEQ
jgi:hypothetical protein